MGETGRVELDESALIFIADRVAERVAERHAACRLTAEEQQAVIDLIKTKRGAVRAFLWITGALMLWILKDAYLYITTHLTLR